MDCLDIEEASVLLPPSFKPKIICPTYGVVVIAAGLEVTAPAFPAWSAIPVLPVMSNRLNASTSRDCLPAPLPGTAVVAGCTASDGAPSVCSNVARVFWKGLAGTNLAFVVVSSVSETSEEPEGGLSNGSSLRLEASSSCGSGDGGS
jgi:hypothetical protein